jgi:formamidopyrimidine-DNA glycosylase
MPELPEVETVARGLSKKILGKTIREVTLHRADIRFPIPKILPAKVRGQKIIAIDRLSKYILLRLADGGRVLIHLGMSGRMFFETEKTYARGKHDHVVFSFPKGLLVIFNDARRFGVIDYIAAKTKAHKLLDAVGMDPFSKDLTPQVLFDKIRTRKTDMKAILMNQKIIAGLGNIYVSEALFRAKMRPTRSGTKVTLKECKKLLSAIRAVLTEAIKAGGSSLRDYVQTDGELGYFQSKFRVYDREGKPCPACKTKIERITQSGRSTYFCSTCQK